MEAEPRVGRQGCKKRHAQIIEQADKGHVAPVSLQDRAMWLARALWVAVFLLALALFLTGIPGRWALAVKEATDQSVEQAQTGLTARLLSWSPALQASFFSCSLVVSSDICSPGLNRAATLCTNGCTRIRRLARSAQSRPR